MDTVTSRRFSVYVTRHWRFEVPQFSGLPRPRRSPSVTVAQHLNDLSGSAIPSRSIQPNRQSFCLSAEVQGRLVKTEMRWFAVVPRWVIISVAAPHTSNSLGARNWGWIMSLTSTASTHEVLNIDELLARCLGNISFATRMLAKFQDRFEQDLLELDKAILAQDTEAVARIAHRIKGASANVAAAQLHESSAEIEQSGRARRLSDISTGVDRLRQEWSRFVDHTSSLELSSWGAS